MLTFKEFYDIAKETVENDSTDVFVKVEGVKYYVTVDEVLDCEEEYPFEASEALANDCNNEAWESLYNQYVDFLLNHM